VITAGHCVYGNLGGERAGRGLAHELDLRARLQQRIRPLRGMDGQGAVDAHQLLQQQTRATGHGRRVIKHQRLRPAHRSTWSAARASPGTTRTISSCTTSATRPGRRSTALPCQYCTGSEFNWSGIANTMGLPCNFTGGSSGGPLADVIPTGSFGLRPTGSTTSATRRCRATSSPRNFGNERPGRSTTRMANL